ncbi:heme ABC transporter ATP-binding protein [Arsenicicoccus sp. oral taxon 190]|nr:heme ABC transporter ATP-binding protein [Arsenicicoccus sp. oral taxon 190]
MVANKDITFSVPKGTIHALVGENGAGKSTLMKILYGVQRADEGTIEIDGREVTFHSPSDAIAAGVGMVFQHFKLADNLTVTENVVLGAEKLHGIGDGAREEIRRISREYGLGIDPDARVGDLGVGHQQRVEILKVLYRGARILILDEPTAVLVPQEVAELFDNLRTLTAEGLTIIFISHKLDEIRQVADDITVIRRGTTVGTADPRTVTKQELSELMVGREMPSPQTEDSTVTDRVVLRLEHVRLARPGGRDVLDDITLSVHAGEILGIAGVEGNGQDELVEVIMGMRDPSSGRVYLGGEDITDWHTRRIREAGVGYVPADRHRYGLLLEAPLWENRILGHQTQPPNTAGPFVNARGAKADTERIVGDYDVRTPSIHVTAGALSGGNQQKLIIGREMAHEPRLLLAAHPTRGVDVGAQAAIWDHIKRARRDGMAVLLITADLDELRGLSDSIRAIVAGTLSEPLPPDLTLKALGAAMMGGDLSEVSLHGDDLDPLAGGAPGTGAPHEAVPGAPDSTLPSAGATRHTAEASTTGGPRTEESPR